MNIAGQYNYILFDAANTVIYKQAHQQILAVLKKHSIDVPAERLQFNHKLLSEATLFPDVTSKEFYTSFNQELLLSLGIIPTNDLLDEIFTSCSRLEWKAFDDTDILSKLPMRLGIISNFSERLPGIINKLFGSIFSHVIVSEKERLQKPSLEFYENAVKQIGLGKEEILYIGDSLKLDVIPAQQLGIKALLIDRQGFYQQHPFTIKSLHELRFN